jgi:hypothetical protein
MLKEIAGMLRFARTLLVIASIPAVSLVARGAQAQTTAPTSTTTTTTVVGSAVPCTATPGGQPTVSVTSQFVPTRMVGNQNLGTNTRNSAQNPNGVSFSDCEQDMVLVFSVTACNFTGQNLQVWASRSSNCQAATDRGLQGGISQCWPVSPGSTGLVSAQSIQPFNIRVQNIVGPENESPSPVTMQSFGASACQVQSTFLAVPININFIPVNPGDGSLAGQAFEYTLATDLVGPPAPANVTIGDGDTLFVVNWTPNLDTDTGGYDVIIDPIPGQEPADGAAAVAADGATGAITTLTCPPEADASTEDGATDGEVGAGPVMDATVDATATAPGTPFPVPADAAFLNDAGCLTGQVGSSSSAGSTTSTCNVCSDSLLTGAFLVDSGSEASVTPVEEFDDAGNLIDSGATSSNMGTGGIFQPPPGHTVNPNATTGTTATGATSSTYTITGLKNGVPYTVVVSAVDNFGNVGPPSTQACDCPAPVNDFWKIYRTDGGNAGGGFCALEAVGAPAGTTAAFAGAGALVIAGLRRRRSKRR